MRPMIITNLRRALTAAWVLMVVSLIGLAAWSHLSSLIIVAGGSMEPDVPQGALIGLAAVDPAVIVAGDVLTVKADNGILITHRVARVLDLPEGRFFELRGDANPSPDPNLVPARSVMGRVDLSVPYVGYVVALLSMPSGLIFWVCALGALLVGIWLLEDLEPGARRTVPSPAVAKAAHGFTA